ncbi:hypothetical protein C8J57DRAFT_1531444 [Mycena rebaudengoi]|nr:hypothetical protein C8J57DRAFT_1531444 [Mycena rebaudengoi]
MRGSVYSAPSSLPLSRPSPILPSPLRPRSTRLSLLPLLLPSSPTPFARPVPPFPSVRPSPTIQSAPAISTYLPTRPPSPSLPALLPSSHVTSLHSLHSLSPADSLRLLPPTCIMTSQPPVPSPPLDPPLRPAPSSRCPHSTYIALLPPAPSRPNHIYTDVMLHTVSPPSPMRLEEWMLIFVAPEFSPIPATGTSVPHLRGCCASHTRLPAPLLMAGAAQVYTFATYRPTTHRQAILPPVPYRPNTPYRPNVAS